jgi:glycosyltransferase involved in cell wall biosynthesis
LGDPTTDVTQLVAEPNVHLLGARAHADLPSVLRGASVGLIPYRSSRLTASIFPMKVYEYLAAGVAIVAAGLPSLAGIDDVWQVTDVAGAVAAIERVLADDSAAARRARSAAARRHSWESRLAEIGAALRT